jgi:UDP-N-acetylmuramate dehydrogenase
MKIKKKYSLKNLTTFGVNAYARELAEVSSTDEIQKLIADRLIPGSRIFILGGGSNILFTKDFDGLVINNLIPGIKIVEEENESCVVEAGAGVKCDGLVQFCVERNLGGIENLSAIPGTVGAAPIQNIGAYGQELEETFYELKAIEIGTGKQTVFNKSECKFSYRDSVFKSKLSNKFIITFVKLKLSKNPLINFSYKPVQEELQRREINNPTIKDIREIVISIRNSKLPDPKKLGNAGSFFKNPVITKEKFEELKKSYKDLKHFAVDENSVKIPAAWLIEECGWKGKRMGNVGTYEKQPLVLVNYGGASGKEILEFSIKIKNSVQSEFGVILENEVIVL